MLGLDSDLLEDDSLGHGRPSHGVGLHGRDGVCLAVFLIVPTLVASVDAELAPGSDSLRLPHFVLLRSCDYEGCVVDKRI